MFKFDFQLFAEIDIPGISEETLKELEAEEQGSQEAADVAEPAEAPKETEEPHADADSDNKQVEATDEFEDVKEGQTIPYDRFKSVNDRRKTAENRIKELEEQLKMAQSQHNVAEPKQVAEPPKAVQSAKPDEMAIPNGSYTKEQEQRIYEMALKNLQKKNNYSDEDMEAFLYADGMEKMNYEDAVRAEVKAVKDGIAQYHAQQKAFSDMNAACVQEFDALDKKLNSYQDAQARWEYISQERFNKLPQRKQAVLQEAFVRLQSKKGTYADMEMINDYFEQANNEWEKAHAGTPAKPVSNNKYAQVDKLPKSGNIGGGGGTNDTMNADRLAEILNEPDGWDKLTPEQQQRILSGSF